MNKDFPACLNLLPIPVRSGALQTHGDLLQRVFPPKTNPGFGVVKVPSLLGQSLRSRILLKPLPAIRGQNPKARHVII